MQGSMRERRPGVWELRVYAGRDANGKVQHRQATFHGNKRAAERALARLVAEVDRGGGAASPPLPAKAPTPSSSPSEAVRPRPSPEPSDAHWVPRWGPQTTVNDAIEGWKRNGWQRT